MHSTEHLGPRKIIGLFDGKIFVTETVFWAMLVGLFMIILALWSTSKMERIPKGKQFWAELIVSGIYKLVGGVLGQDRARSYTFYIGTLFIFLILANGLGMIGFRPATTDPNTTFALSIITFFMIYYASIKAKGVKGHLKHYVEPYAFMIPIKIIEDFSFPVSLAFRLFGNITGGMIVMALSFQGLDAASKALGSSIPFLQYLIPLPLNLFFDIFEPILQAFIFTMLSMAFIGVNSTVHEEH